MLKGWHEKFCLKVHQGLNPSQAFRECHVPTKGAKQAKKWAENTVNSASSRLMKNVKVRARLAELNEQAQKKWEYGFQEYIKELNEAKQLALTQENPNAFLSCIKAKGKAYGLDEPKDKPQDQIYTLNLIDGISLI